MIIELTSQHMEDIDSGKKLIVDNEEWQYVCQDGETEIDENGKSYRFIYRRLSDDKLFRVTNYLCRYGYEDYGFEVEYQDCNAYEVERKEIVRYEWVHVK